MGAHVIINPKYHAEIVGEGIKYAWGAAKSWYRRIRLADKKGKEQFMNNVREALSRDNVLTLKNIRRFSKRLRAYLLTYLELSKEVS